MTTIFSRFASTPSPRAASIRGPAFAASILCAALIHVLVLAFATSALAPAVVGPSAKVGANGRALVVFLANAPTTAAAKSALATSETANDTVKLDASHSGAEPVLPPIPTTVTVQTTAHREILRTEPPRADDRPATRFYTSEEVDTPASPVGEWNLDVADLDAAGIDRLAFDVAVDSTGRIVDCVIVEPTVLVETQRRQLERKLADTAMTAATRANGTVANRRRIEIFAMPVTTRLMNEGPSRVE